MKVNFEFDWAFEATLEPRKEYLIDTFRPPVTQLIERLYKEALIHQKWGGPRAQSTTISDGMAFSRGNESVFLFVGMIVNRDLPPGAVVFVAPTKAAIKSMADIWHKACEERLGGGQKPS